MQAFTIAEVCKKLKIGRSTFYEHVKRGDGPLITKIGTRSIVLDEDLEAWINKLRAENKPS